MTPSIINLCYKEAIKSKCLYKLGCVITKGNKILCSSFNDNMRTSYNGNITCCRHAEMGAVDQLFNRFIRRNLNKFKLKRYKNSKQHRRFYNLSKYTLHVFRIPNDLLLRKKKVIKKSKPCKRCSDKLRDMGFRKICYSNDEGDIIKDDLRKYKTEYLSASQKDTTKYSKII